MTDAASSDGKPTIDAGLVTGGIRSILRELIDGPVEGRGTWILNGGDSGILSTLDTLSPEDASAELIPGRATLAGHANHIRYSLELLNRWARGENPFADADWAGSWRPRAVTQDEWDDLRAALRREAEDWLAAVTAPREWDAITLTGTMSSGAHLAYHFGAIRQLLGLLGHP